MKMSSSFRTKEEIQSFCLALPKVEIHAHLNGSLSLKTIKKLVENHKRKYPLETITSIEEIVSNCSGISSLDNPFEIFPMIQQLTDHPKSIRIATQDVIQDFLDDNVKYLELRSTPKSVPGRMTRQEYVQAILDEILAHKDIIVKLLLSVDRRNSLAVAEETLELFCFFSRQYPLIFVGIDLSGDPRIGDVKGLIALFQYYRQKYNIKFTLHTAETPGQNQETEDLLNFNPERIGHGVFIHPECGGTKKLFNILTKNATPVEICLTSNHIAKIVKNYSDSHFFLLYECQHPIIICTDDKGIFSCTLSGEYEIAGNILKLGPQQLYDLSFKSIDYLFNSDDEKLFLKKMFSDWLLKFKNSNAEICDVN